MTPSFDFEPSITKDYLLSKHSQETYMEHYTGVRVKKGLFISPLRRDSKPTCSFYKNGKGELLLKDFNGSFCGNFISVVMERFGLTYRSALQTIAIDFGIIKRAGAKVNRPLIEYSGEILEETKTADIRVELKDFTEKELKWWDSFGISEKTLKRYHVYSIKHVFLNGNLFGSSTDNVPMYGYYGGKKDGLEMWRIYMPTKRSYRFLSNWSKSMIQGVNKLPASGELLVITKSMKDLMLFHELGIPAIAPNSESTFLNENQINKLKSRFKRIVVLFDNDLPGMQAMKKIHKTTGLDCMWLPRTLAKDISDCWKNKGKRKTLEIVEYGKKILELAA